MDSNDLGKSSAGNAATYRIEGIAKALPENFDVKLHNASFNQQISECCGLAAANIASLAIFFEQNKNKAILSNNVDAFIANKEKYSLFTPVKEGIHMNAYDIYPYIDGFGRAIFTALDQEQKAIGDTSSRNTQLKDALNEINLLHKCNAAKELINQKKSPENIDDFISISQELSLIYDGSYGESFKTAHLLWEKANKECEFLKNMTEPSLNKLYKNTWLMLRNLAEKRWEKEVGKEAQQNNKGKIIDQNGAVAELFKDQKQASKLLQSNTDLYKLCKLALEKKEFISPPIAYTMQNLFNNVQQSQLQTTLNAVPIASNTSTASLNKSFIQKAGDAMGVSSFLQKVGKNSTSEAIKELEGFCGISQRRGM